MSEIKPITEKLDEKIKKLNSSRVFKKITPKGDLSWYIKWVASSFLIVGMMLASVNLFPYNIMVASVGVLGWLIVGMLWHDRALIVLNAVSLAIYLMGVIGHYVQ
tara:strand:- start:2592 stop:2906 length:315 start_codon:yes stop_codon:yes gene_type:complete